MEQNVQHKSEGSLPVSDILEVSLQKIKEMSDTNTVIGEPILTADGTTLVPISKVQIGIIGGGSDPNPLSKTKDKNSFCGGIGTAVKIEPVAFLTVKDGNVRIHDFTSTPQTPIDKVIDAVPEIIDKISAILNPDDTATKSTKAAE